MNRWVPLNLSEKLNHLLKNRFYGLARSESIFHLPHILVASQRWVANADAPSWLTSLSSVWPSLHIFYAVLAELVPQHLLFYFENLLVTLKTDSTIFQNLASEPFR